MADPTGEPDEELAQVVMASLEDFLAESFYSQVKDWLKKIGSRATSAREVLEQDCPKVPLNNCSIFFTLSYWHDMACYHILQVRAVLEKAIEAANSKAVSRANKVLLDNNLDSSDQAGDDTIPEILGPKVCLAFF